MRLPGWLTLTLSVCLLLAVGALGIQMNRAALRSAETVHREDTSGLVANNGALINQYLRLSSEELGNALAARVPSMVPRSVEDQAMLRNLVDRSAFFRFGAAVTDAGGRVLTSVFGIHALPAENDSGYATLLDKLTEGRTGVSAVLHGGENEPVVAVARPIIVDGWVRGALVGYIPLGESLMQSFILRLSNGLTQEGVIDSLGNAVAVSEQSLLGRPAEAAIVHAALNDRTGRPIVVEYRAAEGTAMVAVIITGLEGRWSFFHTQPLSEFYGPIRSRTTQINLVLLGLMLIAGLSVLVMSYRNTTARRRTEAHFAALVQNATDLITVLDRYGRITYDSPSIRVTLGYPTGARIGSPAMAGIHPADRDLVLQKVLQVRKQPGAIDRFQCRLRRLDGSYVWVDLSVSNLLHDSAIRGIVINGRDVSDQRHLQDQLAYQALHDLLTGLPNRRVFQDRMRGAMQAGRAVAVLFVDLDRFKSVNDQWGHDVGDVVLRLVGERLGGCIRPQDTLARVGGDEFVVLLDGVSGQAEAVRVARRVVTAMAEPFTVYGAAIRIGASVGISTSTPDAAGVDGMQLGGEDLLRAADAAMYRAKQSGGLSYRLASISAAS